MDNRRLLITGLALFLLSAGVRFVVWQNNKIEMSAVQSVVANNYKQDARPLLTGNYSEFIAGPDPPSNANVLGHPPGYPLFIAAVWRIFGDGDAFLIVQLLINALAPLVVFAIAVRLVEYRTALLAAVLTALAPQLAYHSGLMLPDELSVLPLLGALYFVSAARTDGRLVYALLAGVAIGVSCWLRANALLLPIFFVIGVGLVFPRRTKLKFAFTFLAAFLVTIAPITIRNAVYFDAFVPLSLGSGTTFLEGLGDYDTDGRLGMPKLDEDVMRMDVARTGREDYYGALYSPDGVERDRDRIKAALDVVARNPGWYAAAVAQRAFTSFRMERVPAIDLSRAEPATTPPLLYYLNRPLKLIQKAFVTAVMLPLFLFGVVVLAWRRPRRRELLLLMIIPVYYALVQSLLHTEYRYVLATPHVMMIVAAAGLSYLWCVIRPQPAEPAEANPEREMSPAS